MSNPFPSFGETKGLVNKFVTTHPQIAWTEVIGTSKEGRNVSAVHVTNRDLPLENKEIFLAVYGRHGNELGTRTAAVGILEWLGTKKANDIRNNQHVIIIPIANPDGSSKNNFHAPNQRLSKLEKELIQNLTERYKPDAVLDVHSLWYNDLQAIIAGHTDSHAEDNMIHQRLAMSMSESAEKNGYTFMAIDRKDIQKVLKYLEYNNFLCKAFHEKIHSLVFGLELSHFNKLPSDVKKSSIACTSTLIKFGNKRFPWQRVSGYPNRILSGDIFTSIRASGRNASQRRESRVKIWKNRKHFKRPRRTTMKNGNIKVQTEYTGEELPSGFEITIRIPNEGVIKSVYLNRKKINGLVTFSDPSSTYVSVPVRTKGNGKYEVKVITS